MSPIQFRNSHEAKTYAAGMAIVTAKLEAATQQKAFARIDTAEIVRQSAAEAMAKLQQLRKAKVLKAAAAEVDRLRPAFKFSTGDARQVKAALKATTTAPTPAKPTGTLHRFCCGPIFG